MLRHWGVAFAACCLGACAGDDESKGGRGGTDGGAGRGGEGGQGGAGGGDAGVVPGCGNGVAEPGEICFAEPVATEVKSVTGRGFVVVDVDGDGELDVVVEENFPNGFSVVPGIGAGAFGNAVTVELTSAVSGTCGLAAADFDGDTLIDVVILEKGEAPAADQLHFAKGDGQLGFTVSSTALAGEPCIGSFAAGDVDGDGALDLVRRAPGMLLTHFGDGNGSFGAPAVFALMGTGGASVLLADLTRDGLPEAAGNLDNRLFIAKNEGGVYASLELTVGTVIDTGDINGDMVPDFVGNDTMDNFLLLLSDGNAGFDGQIMNTPAGGFVTDIEVVDVTNDGQNDLVAALRDEIAVARNEGADGFAPVVKFPLDAPKIEFADVNADGAVDAIGLFGDTRVEISVALSDP